MAQETLQRTLTVRGGIALAIGSIAGSGILYLPSLTYVLAGRNVLLVWLGGTLLCLPLLLMFADVVRLVPDGSGVEGFVEKGLGPHLAATIPLLFLSVVVLGLPASVLVAGEYLQAALAGGALVRLAGAFAVLAVTLVTNLLGATFGARIQQAISLGLLAVVVALCALTFPSAPAHFNALVPSFGDAGAILPGIVVAFWAYAGFENLTFLAGEFRNPRRDFPLAMIIAFLVYGILAVTLTVLIAALIPRGEVSSFSGLSQLAARITPGWLATGIIVLLALTIVQMNVASWMWGMSRLAYSSAKMGRLPRWLAHLDKRGLPGRAVLLLGGIGVVLTSISVAFPNLLAAAFTLASSVFIFIYLLCLASYIRLTRGLGKRLLYGALFLFLCTTLASVGLKALYPLIVFLLALLASLLRARRQNMHRDTRQHK